MPPTERTVRCIMLTDRQALGIKGEEIAAEWLQQRGWRILDRRFRSGHRDIDLIAARHECGTRDRLVAFVEVRTRRSSAFRCPTETVQWKKQRELRKIARQWIASNACSASAFRFDVIGVSMDGDHPKIEYIPNAF